MLYNKGNHAQLKRVQPQPSRLQGENGGKIYSTWNPGRTHLGLTPFVSFGGCPPDELHMINSSEVLFE